ncbi:MAG: tetratricopeptide repeat protein [Deltaproteobacteria bacterium]|nr:tetratricopeptide repeat protein [Deltaproteobacteria bacterium]
MDVKTKRLLMVAVPVCAAALIIFALTKIDPERRKAKVAAAAAAKTAVMDAPSGNPVADRAHERKSLELELAKNPAHSPILFRLAEIARDEGKNSEAIEHLRAILEHEPSNTEARIELGRILFDTGAVDKAIEETKKVLEQDPKQVDALYNLGAIYANTNRPDLARQFWTQAAASNPGSDSGKRAAESLNKLPPH